MFCQNLLDWYQNMENSTTTVCNTMMARTRTTGVTSDRNKVSDQARRHFLKLNLLALAFAPTASLLVGPSAWAGRTAGRTGRIVNVTPVVLDPEESHAQALSYSAHSSKGVQSCGNCRLYTGAVREKLGPRAIFSHRPGPNGSQLMVSATGWCRAWGLRQPV